jgi:hexosaminidase
MPSFKHVEYMVFPRLCAIAEVDWSPKDSRHWDDFLRRARADCERLDALGVNHRALK